MRNIALQISEDELDQVLQAYQTIQRFVEKLVSPNELYQREFLTGLQEALHDVQSGNIAEVGSFDDFIA